MIRGVTSAIYGLIFLFLGLLSGDAVSLYQLVDREVQAGQEFDVSITVDKGSLESFARFHVDLPRGLTAVSGNSENSTFRFEDQQVKFVWLRLPQEDKFTINYSVRVDPRMMGTFQLGGELAYISKNERQVANVNVETIRIKPSSRVDESKRLDIEEYQHSIPAQRPVDMSRLAVRCIRETPSIIEPGPDRIVRLLVRRGEAEKFAKIEETIPPSYSAEPVETKEAIFSFQDGVVKFLWMNLPPEEMFTVAYRLIPAGPAVTGTPDINGTFSFVQEEATRSIAIAQRDVQINNLTNEQLEALAQSTPNRAPSARRPVVTRETGGTLRPEGPSQGGIEYPVRYKKIEAISGHTPHRRRPISMDEYLLEPEQGVYYRVQVAAGHRPIEISRYFKKLSLNAEVRTERHEGWYKYSVGSFKEYKEARDYRVRIWNTTPINDAFVAAYNNGKRITVQEALMITSQKWYK